MKSKTCKQVEISCENWPHRKSGTRWSPEEIRAAHIAGLEGEAFNVTAKRHDRTKYAVRTMSSKIAEDYGYDENNIRRIGGGLKTVNLEYKCRKDFTWTKYEVRFVIGRKKLGESHKQIAKQVGRTENAIKDFFKKYKHQNRPTLFDAQTSQLPKPALNSHIELLVRQNNQHTLSR